MSVPQAVATGEAALPRAVTTADATLPLPQAIATQQVEQTIAAGVATTQARQTAERSTALALPSPTPVPTPYLIAQRDYGAWNYKAYRSGEKISVAISYDDDSIQGIKAFAEANRQLVDKVAAGGGVLEVSITFRNYLAPDEFRSWVAANDIKVQDSLTSVEISKEVHGPTFANGVIEPQMGDPLPQDALDDMMSTVSNWGTKSTLRGVYCTVARIEAQQLPKISGDPLVYMVDLTQAVVRDELAASDIPPSQLNDIHFNGASSPFPAMSQFFGLENFEQ